MNKTLLAALVATTFTPLAQAIDIYQDEKNTVAIGGWVDVRAINTQGESEVASGASRINFSFNRALKNNWQAFAKLEWSVNPVGSSNYILQGDNAFQQNQGDFMNNRLGYVGLSHDKFGRISMGKQWGAWYDVVCYTNIVYRGDGNASGTYTYNKFDGAINGTGRGDKTIQYRNDFGALSVAAQVQLKQEDFKIEASDAESDAESKPVFFSDESVTALEFGDTFGLGLTYTISDDLLVTAGFNVGEFEFTNQDGRQFEETDYIYGAGFAYGGWKKPGHYAAANINFNEYHDTDNLGRMIPKSMGIEMLASYLYENNVRLMVSYNLLDAADEYSDLYQGDVFKRQSMVFGVHYLFDSSTVVFAEYSANLGDFSGQREADMERSEDDAVLFGLRYSL